MRVTVCQLSDSRDEFESGWAALCDHVRREQSQLVLLPEMPFSTWFAAAANFETKVWEQAVAEHRRWRARLIELAPAIAICTEPAGRRGRRRNEAYVWRDGSTEALHRKRYLPNEEGFWEANWYEPNPVAAFELATLEGASVGVQICTEIWWMDVSRWYGVEGADLLVVPRATPASSRERWLVAGRAAAIVAGAFCLSSNRSGCSHIGCEFAGLGWIIDPEGEVLARTSEEQPFVTVDIDLARAREAKSSYPRYVR
jgi:N-carbamoylputrescine amidase